MFHSGAKLLGSTRSVLLQRYWAQHVPFCCNVAELTACSILVQRYWGDCMLHSVAVLLGWLHVAFWCSVVRVIACCILLQCYWADCMFHDLCLFEIFCVPVLHSCMFVLLYRNRLLQIKVEICWESLWVVFFNPHGRSMSVAFLNLFLYADWDLSSSHPLSRHPPPPAPLVHPPLPMHSQKRSLDSMFSSEVDVAEWLNWHPYVHRLVFGTAGLQFSPCWTLVHRCALS